MSFTLDLPDQFRVSGIDPKTGRTATAVVIALGDDSLTLTAGSPVAGGTTTQVFDASVFEAGVFE